MKTRYALVLAASLAGSLVLSAVSAFAAVPVAGPSPRFAGHYVIDYSSGSARLVTAPTGAQIAGDVYVNESTIQGGFADSDLGATMGDRVTTTASGVLEEFDFTVYNAGTNSGALFTSTHNIEFYDGPSGIPLGGFNVNSSYTGLNPGYYSIVSLTGLSALNLSLPTDVIVTQQMTAHTGTTNKLGVVIFDPPTVGSSAPDFYVSASDIAAGWYTLSGVNANLGYRINVTNPVPARTSTWGSLKALYH